MFVNNVGVKAFSKNCDQRNAQINCFSLGKKQTAYSVSEIKFFFVTAVTEGKVFFFSRHTKNMYFRLQFTSGRNPMFLLGRSGGFWHKRNHATDGKRRF